MRHIQFSNGIFRNSFKRERQLLTLLPRLWRVLLSVTHLAITMGMLTHSNMVILLCLALNLCLVFSLFKVSSLCLSLNLYLVLNL